MDNETIPLDSSSSSAEEPLFILSLLNNELMSSSWKLSNKDYKIGRSSENNIILDDITVSRNHALLSVNNEYIKITDNNSTNGIYINNVIKSDSELKSGDKIQIGKYLIAASVLLSGLALLFFILKKDIYSPLKINNLLKIFFLSNLVFLS